MNGNQSDNNSPEAGAVYVFVRSGTTWSQQAYLKASNTGTFDYFGWSAAVSGDTVVVGAWKEDSSATGVNGNPSDNSASDAGAAYVFSDLGVGPRLALVPDGGGGYFIRFNGAPDVAYRLQRAASLTGPWISGAPQTAPASGFVEFHDLFPLPDQAFYRTFQP